MWRAYNNYRTVVTLMGAVRLRLMIRRCVEAKCARYGRPYRPEAEGFYALPKQEMGLDVIARVGALRHREHRSVPEIHAQLRVEGVEVSVREVAYLLERYDELVATVLEDPARLRAVVRKQKHLILALDGRQPHKGHEVPWIVRECQSGEVLLARTLLSATTADLAALLEAVRERLGALGKGIPKVAGLLSDGQTTIRKAVAEVFPGVPHQLCQFHFLREAARPISEADRHAKKELKKAIRGVRAVERSVESDAGEAGAVVRTARPSAARSIPRTGRPCGRRG
jgi:hypothetical protein